MKNPQLFMKISLTMGLVALLMTVGDYLALHDIWHDYVSKQVIETYGGNTNLNIKNGTIQKINITRPNRRS